MCFLGFGRGGKVVWNDGLVGCGLFVFLMCLMIWYIGCVRKVINFGFVGFGSYLVVLDGFV